MTLGITLSHKFTESIPRNYTETEMIDYLKTYINDDIRLLEMYSQAKMLDETYTIELDSLLADTYRQLRDDKIDSMAVYITKEQDELLFKRIADCTYDEPNTGKLEHSLEFFKSELYDYLDDIVIDPSV